MTSNHLMSRRRQYFSPIVIRSREVHGNNQEDLRDLDLELREKREANIARSTMYLHPEVLHLPRGLFLPERQGVDPCYDETFPGVELDGPEASRIVPFLEEESQYSYSGLSGNSPTFASPTSVVPDHKSIQSVPFLPFGDYNKPRSPIKLSPRKPVFRGADWSVGTVGHCFLPLDSTDKVYEHDHRAS